MKMEVSDVSDWLRSIKMDKYVECFEKDGVDGAFLSQIDDECLKDLGVSRVIDRRKIIGNIEKLRLSGLQPSS